MSQDGYEECMPNIHDHDDGEDDHDTEDILNTTTTTDDIAQRDAQKPRSRSISISYAIPTPKPSKPSNSTPRVEEESHTCPICSKTLQTDNQGLNAHIDFCLSKGAIREAQAAASGSAGKSKGKSKGKVREKEKVKGNGLREWTKRTSSGSGKKRR